MAGDGGGMLKNTIFAHSPTPLTHLDQYMGPRGPPQVPTGIQCLLRTRKKSKRPYFFKLTGFYPSSGFFLINFLPRKISRKYIFRVSIHNLTGGNFHWKKTFTADKQIESFQVNFHYLLDFLKNLLSELARFARKTWKNPKNSPPAALIREPYIVWELSRF